MTSHLTAPSPPPALDWSRIRRLGFYVFCLLVAVNALLGISAFVGDYTNESEILGTSIVLTFAVLGALANAPTFERGRYWLVAIVGVLSFCVFAVIMIIGIWDDYYFEDGMAELMFSALFVGIGATYISILSIIRLTPAQAPIRSLAYVAAAAGVSLSLIAVQESADDLATPIGISVIIAAALAIVLPVMGRLNRAEAAALPAAKFCPMCAAPVEGADQRGQQRCSVCGTGFSLQRTD